jgi:hypothetical protein
MMFSLKPGRGKSFKDFLGSIVSVVFGVVWTIVVYQSDTTFALFGLVAILGGVVDALFNFYNAFGRNRFSALDATAAGEEPDPFATVIGRETSESAKVKTGPRQYPGENCPFCGTKVKGIYDYCPNCGKDI